jgi:uncharacterized protein VirK/YbjX
MVWLTSSFNALSLRLKEDPWAIPQDLLKFAQIFVYPGMQLKIQSLEIVKKYVAPHSYLSPFVAQHFFKYLSAALSTYEKIDCALTHFKFEENYRDHTYKEDVYGGTGLTLWSRIVNGRTYKITLKASDRVTEGELSVLLMCDESLFSIMSFSYIDKRCFGLTPGLSLMVTRNQTYHQRAGSIFFHDDMKQNFPPHFLLAAIYGIAQTNNFHEFLAIPSQHQIFYNGRPGFCNSYDELWKRFNGVDCGRSYLLKLPMDIGSISSVKAKHRRRAASRRGHWQEVIDSTMATLKKTRRF